MLRKTCFCLSRKLEIFRGNMGQRIIKKDNGLYAVWTTICDSFLMDDVTKEEVIEQLSEWAKEDAKERLKMQFEHNLHISTDYEGYCETRDRLHSEEEEE